MSNFKSSWITSTEGFRSLRKEWSALLQDSDTNHLFITWEWLYTWWQVLGQRSKLWLLTVRSEVTLIAIVPLMVLPGEPLRLRPFGSLAFLGSGYAGSDYLSVLVRSGWQQDVLPVIARELTDSGKNLKLTNLDCACSVMATLRSQLQTSGWRSRIADTDRSPYIDLRNLTWETYVASLGKSHASDIRRKTRKVEEAYTMTLALMESQTDRQKALDVLIEQHMKRWDRRGGSTAFHAPELVQFHNCFSALALEMGWLRFFVLQLDGAPAASVYAFNYRNVYYYYQTAFDEQFSRYSVGKLAIAKTIEYAISEGAQEYDFLHGTERYKYFWTNGERELVCLDMFPPGTQGYAAEKVMHIREQLKRLVKPLLPARIGTFLRQDR